MHFAFSYWLQKPALPVLLHLLLPFCVDFRSYQQACWGTHWPFEYGQTTVLKNFGESRNGGGGGLPKGLLGPKKFTPTYIPQSDQCVALIILACMLGGKAFWTKICTSRGRGGEWPSSQSGLGWGEGGGQNIIFSYFSRVFKISTNSEHFQHTHMG